MSTSSQGRKAALIALWLLLFIAFAGLASLFGKLSAYDKTLAATDGDTIVSLELAFTAERAAKVVDGWTTASIDSIARSSIHWDWAFIVTFLVLMLCISALVLRAKYPSPPHWAQLPLILLPWSVALFDGIENLGLYYLLGNQQGFVFAVVAFLVSLFAALKFLLLFAFVVVVIRSRHVNLRVLSLVRFSLLMLAVGVATLFVAQWQEVLRAIGENLDPTRHLAFWFGFAALVASITAWYSARVMFMLKIPGQEELSSRDTAPLVKTWLPRVLGWAILLIVGIGLIQAAGVAWAPIAWLLVALLLYSAFVLLRRRIPYFDIGPTTDTFGSADGWLNLPRPTKRVLMVLAVLNVTAFAVTLIDPLVVRSVGGAAVVLGAVGLMIPIGTWLVYWGARWKLPVLLILFALAALFSQFNDNHWIRPTPDASSTDGTQRLLRSEPVNEDFNGIENYARAWARSRAASLPGDGDIPLFIVSAEGGGIRAAYWTAQVLAALQDEEPLFSRHVFAISGVSGGSLGGAVFSAQVAGETPRGTFKEQADDMLREDFLAPTLASLLFPDLLQRFLPWPVFEDRAVTLEHGWEDAWRRASKGDEAFANPFSMLWPESKSTANRESATDSTVPLLFLNSTVVESGNRLIMQPLVFSGQNGGFSRLFKDAIDGRAALGTNVPLSTAVHLSARFTYVSPAGSARNHAVPEHDGPAWIRLVDGGYFENSGTVTSTELMVALRRMIDAPNADPAVARLRPFVIHISNDPVPLDRNQTRLGREKKQAALGEALSPLLALLHARPARGYQARDALFGLMSRDGDDADYVHFELYDLGTTLPLGWVLSSAARLNMRAQVEKLTEPGTDSDLTDKSADMQEARRRNNERIGRVLGFFGAKL